MAALLIEGIPLGIADWGPTTFVGLIVILVLTERLVGRGRLTEKNEEIALWRSKSERETAINEKNAETNSKNAESIKNLADAALLKEEIARAVREETARERMAAFRPEGEPGQQHQQQQQEQQEQSAPEGSDA